MKIMPAIGTLRRKVRAGWLQWSGRERPPLLVDHPQQRRLSRPWHIAALVALAGAGLGAGGAALAVGPAASGLVAPADTAETANGNPAGLTRLQHPE
jgi:hypothetical protein